MLKFFIAVLILLIPLTGCSRANDHNQPTVRIAYIPITHSAAVMVLPEIAQPDDDFRIELIRFTAWPEVVEALRAGHVDAASILIEVAMRAFEMDDSLAVVSLSHRDGNVIVVSNDIRSYACLVGQTVAIPHALSPHNALLRKVLEREGIGIDEINLVEISPAEMPFTMAARAISAYVVAEPWGSLAEARGIGRILENSDEIRPDAVCCVMLFNTQIFEAYDGLHDWFLNRFEEAAALAEARHDSVFNAFRRRTNFEIEIIAQSLENTSFQNLVFTAEDFESVAETILRFEILETIPHFEDFVRRGN